MGTLFGLAALLLAATVWKRVADLRVPPFERVLDAGVLTMLVLGFEAIALGLAGWFSAPTMAGLTALVAVTLWKWPQRESVSPSKRSRLIPREALVLAAVVAGAIALRLPAADYPLAGRDQGTYTLRAQQTIRSRSIAAIDPIVARAAMEVHERPGPGDILGLYPLRSERWVRGHYDGAYRPGWYLASRERGVIVPQFLHLHPLLMATWGLVFGADAVAGIVIVQATLAIVALFCVARRLWPNGLWAYAACSVFVLNPLVIWVQRTAVSETLAGLLVLAAAANALRAQQDGDVRALDRAALFLGALAWVRGNGLLAAPLVLATLWLVPSRPSGRRRASAIYLGTVTSSAIVHAWTSFPYLYDEFHRLVGALDRLLTPWYLSALALVGAIAWLSVDELHSVSPSPREVSASRSAIRLASVASWIREHAGWIAIVTVVGAVVMYLATSGALGSGPEQPFRRLDPTWAVLGGPVCIAAVVGMASLATARIRSVADTWLFALILLWAATLWLYTLPSLPSTALYYYGRYLVPEIVPGAGLLAIEGVRRLTSALRRRAPPKIAAAFGGAAFFGLLWPSRVLVTDPVTRLVEYQGTERLVKSLAGELDPDAVVIAGGEGWHHGHTFNQVAGALAFRYGYTVLPYVTKEAAYATAYELLVAGPAARAEPAPKVYLLLNEATHHYVPDDGEPDNDPDAPLVAAIDDALAPPFVATGIFAAEIYSHRLTAVGPALPTRVTRDVLRMALFELGVDRSPQRERVWEATASGELVEHSIGSPPGRGAPPLCLHRDRDTVLELAPWGTGPQSLVIVTMPGTTRAGDAPAIEIDARTIEPWPVGGPEVERDTWGPFVLRSGPRRLRVRGTKRRSSSAVCPFGGIAEIRQLAPDRSALVEVSLRSESFAPPFDFGRPITSASWVSGRGLSRYRAGIDPAPEIVAESVSLRRGQTITFAPQWLPGRGAAPFDLVVNLARIDIGPDATLAVYLDGRELSVQTLGGPRSQHWQSEPVRVRPDDIVGRFSLELRGPDDTRGSVLVRDIGLFAADSTVGTAPSPDARIE